MPETNDSPLDEGDFLKDKYWDKDEFRVAAEKTARRRQRADEDRALPTKPSEQISLYLARIERIVKKWPTTFRDRLYPKLLSRPKDITDEYLKNVLFGEFVEQQGYTANQLAHPEQGPTLKATLRQQFEHRYTNDTPLGDWRVPDQLRSERVRMAIRDQETSLNQWFDYLTGPQAEHYPAAFRYWAMAEAVKLGPYDYGRKSFNQRESGTVTRFPELDQQALALIFDEVEKHRTDQPSLLELTDPQAQEFKKRLQTENFGKLYSWALEYVNSLRLPEERLAITSGQWRKFAKGSDPKALAAALQGFNTGWCIAGEGTAASYLEKYDVWTFFSDDEANQLKIPRATIVTDGQTISEVRGIINRKDAKQHLDSYITPVVEAKLAELAGGDAWQTTMADMRHLATLKLKSLRGELLDRVDLIFLYEVDRPIRSSGYDRDPRVDELRGGRDPEADMLTVFDCTPEQIAHAPEAITADTKAYVGPLVQTDADGRIVPIFDLLQRSVIEHVYTQPFPEGRIQRERRSYGGQTGEELVAELAEERTRRKTTEGLRPLTFPAWAESMHTNPQFEALRQKEATTDDFVRLTVGDLGLDNVTFDEIKSRALQLGLELCPSDLAAHIMMDWSVRDEPPGTWFYVASEPVPDSDGKLNVFCCHSREDELRLNGDYAGPSSRWASWRPFLFRLPASPAGR
ncbi:hypothetical protein HY375_02430 [Candidatus Berkelbacteria bacterium]|nr:hypothetical protein [Candidatus Berkelbacteria bacterium]